MKKTIVALAVTASTLSAAQAQNIVIDGYFDRAYTATNSSDNARDTIGFASSSGTTFIGFSGSEDLGGGLRASFRINTEFNDLGGYNLDVGAAGAQNEQQGYFANGPAWVQIGSSNFGDIRMGVINNETLNAMLVANPGLSTGVGSFYTTAFATHTGISTGNTANVGQPQLAAHTNATARYAGARNIRQTNSIYYYSPAIGPVRLAAGMAPQNAGKDAAGAETIGSSEFSIRFTQGPVDAMYAEIRMDAGNAGTAAAATGSPGSSGIPAGVQQTNRTGAIGFSVTPALRLHAGYYTSKSVGMRTVAGAGSDVDFNTTATSVGIRYNISPTLALAAVNASVNDKSTFNMDRRMTGAGLDYTLSKRTRAYLRYDTIVTDEDNAGTAGNRLNRTAIGVAHTF